MVGALPNVNDKEKWSKTIAAQRSNFVLLKDKYLNLKNQLSVPNPLASLKSANFCPSELFNSKEDRSMKILIRKDVERTH